MRNISATAKALTRATLAGGAMVLTLSLGSVAVQAATAVTFDPGAFVPGASSFTADVLNLKDYSRVDLGASSGGSTAFTEKGFLLVNNASLGSETFNPTGNRDAYTLYFQYNGTGTQNATDFTSSSQGVFTGLTYTLYGAVGESSFSVDGSQPTVSNEGATTVLATGSLINGTTSFSANPTGAAANISATYIEQLSNFILSPTNSTLRVFGAFNNNEQIVTVVNDGRSFLINGGGGDISFTATTNPTPVPEPASMILFGTALIGLGAAARRRKSV
ncbi:flocculation-associated PEP-CTERM protein PepA [Muricoccus vinaceus]|uniref:Flocculation-associated PEP-CTERM protein PepA n=1 Tax=Muricoccus vinaceus TaxID=424704 RepID=A0ABV6INA7_9PROT